MQSGSHNYLDKRRGLGGECWDLCDCSPCQCSKEMKRLIRKKWRQKDKKIIREQLKDLGL